ncbi:hypothetical protein [Marinitenerispora sediminis]|uniref:Uncharacterized protein n=1 Tax=Marinitenerispora sediminis TaxID=1931232 RepID=A0A368T3H7_9ACTN|nr:hypothetical protein [Marinitenerispora sediminis]RCV48181.1 hypothetical protein DEF28_24280 [Marinitenerispora sediminis]RCV49355.1 hypothetical protein DEF23_23740 [Marinitenerispora sediminis]RCV51947.1 hypothetical protein DEF24_22625 [Marinitenerispora sediminis]
MTTTQTGRPLNGDRMVVLLKEFGIEVENAPGRTAGAMAAVQLAYALLGAAERNAIDAEQAAIAAGSEDFGPAAHSRAVAAGVRSEVEEFALAEWQVTRLTQALGRLVGDGSEQPDEEGVVANRLGRAIELTGAALAALLSAAASVRDTQRDDDDSRAAAADMLDAMRALDRAQTALH